MVFFLALAVPYIVFGGLGALGMIGGAALVLDKIDAKAAAKAAAAEVVAKAAAAEVAAKAAAAKVAAEAEAAAKAVATKVAVAETAARLLSNYRQMR